MRYLPWIALVLLLLVMGCGTTDPIVGQWSDTAKSGLTMTMHANNTIAFSYDVEQAMTYLRATRAGMDQASMKKLIQAQVDHLTGTWKKTGAVYTIVIRNNGSSDTSYMTIEQEYLMSCDADGKPLNSNKFVRMK